MQGKQQTIDKRPGRRGSSGSNTSTSSVQPRPEIKVPHTMPFTARLPPDENREWINNKGQKNQDREVVGDKVVIRQQPASVPPKPQILVLTDQMMEAFQRPDKYLNVLAMVGYSMMEYVKDVQDDLINLDFPYIVIYLGTMQLGVFDSREVHRHVKDLVSAIAAVSPSLLITFTGLVPQPMDHPRSRVRCENFSCALCLSTDEFRKTRGFNCNYLQVYQEFLHQDGTIKNPSDNFIEDVYLLPTGIRILRVAWLRHFGFFPQKTK